MASIPHIAEHHDELTEWRRQLHAHPETAFEEYQTSAFVVEKLKSFGLEVHCGLAKTGVVGTLRVGTGSRAIGLRSDMDALDLTELNEFSHRSTVAGKMHACGHDGHVAMLLGAARHLAESRKFDGTVQFIFQPAEENEAGGRVMVEQGLFDRFPVQAVFSLHNMPGFEVGTFATRVGPLMASADFFFITVRGTGSHAATPQAAADPIPVAAQIVLALQTIVSRNLDPIDSAVITITQINGGTTTNIIPEKVKIAGTVRAFRPQVQSHIEERIRQIAHHVAAAHDTTAEVHYESRYPATVNHLAETELALAAAADVAGPSDVQRDVTPIMGAEDFAWMLQVKPGNCMWLGNGKGGHFVHTARYDFNDAVLPIGVSYWVRLVERFLPPSR
jgi:hippurate hydrolase